MMPFGALNAGKGAVDATEFKVVFKGAMHAINVIIIWYGWNRISSQSIPV